LFPPLFFLVLNQPKHCPQKQRSLEIVGLSAYKIRHFHPPLLKVDRSSVDFCQLVLLQSFIFEISATPMLLVHDHHVDIFPFPAFLSPLPISVWLIHLVCEARPTQASPLPPIHYAPIVRGLDFPPSKYIVLFFHDLFPIPHLAY